MESKLQIRRTVVITHIYMMKPPPQTPKCRASKLLGWRAHQGAKTQDLSQPYPLYVFIRLLSGPFMDMI